MSTLDLQRESTNIQELSDVITRLYPQQVYRINSQALVEILSHLNLEELNMVKTWCRKQEYDKLDQLVDALLSAEARGFLFRRSIRGCSLCF